jgi:hypothetical protein
MMEPAPQKTQANAKTPSNPQSSPPNSSPEQVKLLLNRLLTIAIVLYGLIAIGSLLW